MIQIVSKNLRSKVSIPQLVKVSDGDPLHLQADTQLSADFYLVFLQDFHCARTHRSQTKKPDSQHIFLHLHHSCLKSFASSAQSTPISEHQGWPTIFPAEHLHHLSFFPFQRKWRHWPPLAKEFPD